MRALYIILCAIALVYASVPATSQEPKGGGAPVAAYLVNADAFDVAEALEADPRKARKDYSPTKPPPGVMGGRIVMISGVVAKAEKDKVQVASGNGWHLLAKGKMSGKGPYLSVSVDSISLAADGSKLAVIEGTITRSETPLMHALEKK